MIKTIVKDILFLGQKSEIATRDDMQADKEMDRDIELAEAEYAENGIAYDAREALSTLQRKHFG